MYFHMPNIANMLHWFENTISRWLHVCVCVLTPPMNFLKFYKLWELANRTHFYASLSLIWRTIPNYAMIYIITYLSICTYLNLLRMDETSGSRWLIFTPRNRHSPNTGSFNTNSCKFTTVTHTQRPGCHSKSGVGKGPRQQIHRTKRFRN